VLPDLQAGILSQAPAFSDPCGSYACKMTTQAELFPLTPLPCWFSTRTA
jgi:hypothetical protein